MDPVEERREFYRVDFRYPVKFRQVRDTGDNLRLGTCENISISGILFKTPIIPQLSSVLWMDVDFRTLKICREIEEEVLVHEEGLLGKVVRVEEDPEEKMLYNVGVCFLRKKDVNGVKSW